MNGSSQPLIQVSPQVRNVLGVLGVFLSGLVINWISDAYHPAAIVILTLVAVSLVLLLVFSRHVSTLSSPSLSGISPALLELTQFGLFYSAPWWRFLLARRHTHASG
jgi:hypothetical protein